MKKVNPDMIGIARDARMLTIGDLSEKTGIPKGILRRYERQIIVLGDPAIYAEDHINKIADVLGYPVAFFYQEGKRHPVFICSR